MHLHTLSHSLHVQFVAELFTGSSLSSVEFETVAVCLLSTKVFKPSDLNSELRENICSHELLDSVDINGGRIVVGLSELGKKKLMEFNDNMQEGINRCVRF